MTSIWQQHEKYATPSQLLHYVSAKTYELHTVNAHKFFLLCYV
jgi:hypothetical protein